MPVSGASFTRSTTIFLLIGFGALLAIVAMSLWLGHRTQVYFDEVIEARDARAATTDLRGRLQDIETGQRGFLLTLDETYLEPFNDARAKVIPAYERMREVLKPYPQADEAMAKLRLAIDEKIAETERTIALARDGQREQALAIVTTDRGKALMDEARTLFNAVIAAADRRLVAGSEEQRATATLLRWVTVLGALVIVAVVGGSVWTAVSYTRDLVAARGEVERLNFGLEERVRERTLDLRRANEEVQRFAYIVTHDLRAPLVNIMGFTSELEASLKAIAAASAKRGDGPPTDPVELEAHRAATEDLPEAISFIRSSTQKMDGLINAILKLSREGRRPLKAETVDLGDLVERSAASVAHQVSEADGEIAFDLQARSIVGDRMSLEQMVGNLLDNAVKYRDAGRPLALTIRTRAVPGRRVAIEVEDNGRGIAKQDHDRVFELFRRSGVQDLPGEGIGLPHVRSLARALGGDVTVRSTLGQGSIFTILLPDDARAVIASAQKDTPDMDKTA